MKIITVIGVLFAVVCTPSEAAAPHVKTQPGFYRMMLGAFEVTALNDGVISYPTSQVLPTATPKQIRWGLYESGLADPVGMSYNAFLINTGKKLVLIDTGTGGKLDDQPEFHGAGHLMANLRAAGYRPEQVDEVLITHRGQDHIGGLAIGRARAFPNAVVYAPESEFATFLDGPKATVLLAQAHNDKRAKAWIQFTKDQFEPYIAAGKLRSFDGDITIVPGIRALATYGHTPGHTSYVVQSQSQTLIVMGDLVLMGALQFAEPSLGSAFDVDPKAAAQQRIRVFRMAADHNYWVAGGHLSFPGIGHIRTEHDRFSWVPANYTIPQ